VLTQEKLQQRQQEQEARQVRQLPARTSRCRWGMMPQWRLARVLLSPVAAHTACVRRCAGVRGAV
jgi:hypothetical protein